jgi:SAM-dependent methyltransferase
MDPSPYTPPVQFPVGVPDGDTVVYGPDIADERSLRLLGSVEGRRILELGVGNGRNSVALARQGAKVIAVDPDPERLEVARALADRHEVKVEFHLGDLADIAFVRADTVDTVLTVHALATVADPDRVFRQVHRVLRTEAAMVMSVPHPAWDLIAPDGDDPLRIARSWFDMSPRSDTGPNAGDEAGVVTYPTTFGTLFGGLYRAGFRVESVLEPQAEPGQNPSRWWHDAMRMLPATLVLRVRKVGL